MVSTVVVQDLRPIGVAELATVLVAIGWTVWVGRWPQGAVLTLALVTAGAETVGVLAMYTSLLAGQGGEFAALDLLAAFSFVPAAYGFTSIVLVVTATLGQVVRRRPRPGRGPWWLSVGWPCLIAAGPFTIFGGLTAPQAIAVAAAIALTCLAAGGYVGATNRWTSTPGLLATAIAAVLVAAAGVTAIGWARGGLVIQWQWVDIVLTSLDLTGIVCFLFAVGAALCGGVASLVPRRSRAAVVGTADRP
jgi:hypothetical protein